MTDRRGKPPDEARKLAGDPEFRAEMTSLFEGAPPGRFEVPSLAVIGGQLAAVLQRLDRLEARLDAVERKGS
jgi:hypothetical protein